MGKGGQGEKEVKPSIDREALYTREEVRQHNKPDDLWVILEDKVYDLTEWRHRHPGGWQVLQDHAGFDATHPFNLYHMNQEKVRKYMKPFQRGKLSGPKYNERQMAIENDYIELRKTAEKLNLFKPKHWFLGLYFVQNIGLAVLAYYIIATFGIGWIPFLTAGFALGTAHLHSIAIMHDLGHRSRTHNVWLDHIMQLFFMSFTLGFSASFWNEYHSRHHSKPNQYGKDPTIDINDHLFVVGDGMAKEKAAKNRKEGKASVPYQIQHYYWIILGPTLLVPVRFQMASIMYCVNRRKYLDLVVMAAMILTNIYLYVPHMGWWNFLLYLWFVRQVMSHWFVWMSLANHLALPELYEPKEGYTWFELQLHPTINLPDNYFADWYTGGLNMQIEHHLFTDMPREHFRTIKPYVLKMCEKHNIPYKEASSGFSGCKGVYDMLKRSGKTWYDAYYHALAGM